MKKLIIAFLVVISFASCKSVNTYQVYCVDLGHTPYFTQIQSTEDYQTGEMRNINGHTYIIKHVLDINLK